MYYFGTGKVTTAAAVYKADMGADIQSIEAVGVGFASADNDYTVKIYGDLENTLKPDSGTLLTMQTGTTLYEGFYTIELDNPVPVKKVEAFSVVIEVENSESALMYADTSYNGGWIEFEAKTNPGETFFKYGSSWNDAAIAYAMTMRIKAFTKDAEVVIENELTEDMIATIPVRTYTER